MPPKKRVSIGRSTKHALHIKRRRANETFEERSARLEKSRIRLAERRKYETTEERNHRLSAARRRMALKRTNKKHIVNQEQQFKGKPPFNMPIGTIYWADEACSFVCSLCKSLKKFKQLKTFVRHLKSTHIDLIQDQAEVLNCPIRDNKDGFVVTEYLERNDNNNEIESFSTQRHHSIESTSMLPAEYLPKQENFDIDLHTPIDDTTMQNYQQELSGHFLERNLIFNTIKCEINEEENCNSLEIRSKQFHCNNCKTSFILAEELLEHFCPNAASTSNSLNITEDLFRCTFCTATFSSRRELNAHLVCHEIDGYANSNASNKFKNLMKQSTDKVEFKHKCDICNKTYKTACSLTSHRQRYHPHIKDHKCTQCGEAFISSGRLRSHMIAAHNTKQFHKCSECPKTFKSYSGVKNHLKTHTAIPKCIVCKTTFDTDFDLQLHLKTHTTNLVEPGTYTTDNSSTFSIKQERIDEEDFIAKNITLPFEQNTDTELSSVITETQAENNGHKLFSKSELSMKDVEELNSNHTVEEDKSAQASKNYQDNRSVPQFPC